MWSGPGGGGGKGPGRGPGPGNGWEGNPKWPVMRVAVHASSATVAGIAHYQRYCGLFFEISPWKLLLLGQWGWKYLARFTVRERKVKRTGRPGAIVPRRRNARLGIYRSRGTFRGYNGAC